MDYFGYTIACFIPCEVCGARATDVHHIDCRGIGGDPQGKKDVIENLMGLCRTCHNTFGDIVAYVEKLIKIHLLFMKNNKR